MLILAFNEVENIMEKFDTAYKRQFLFFPQCFQKPSLSRLLKPRNVYNASNLTKSRFYLVSDKSINTISLYACS